MQIYIVGTELPCDLTYELLHNMFRIAFFLIVLSLLTGLVAGLQHAQAVADYQKCCKRVSELLDHYRFKEASSLAARAIQIRACANPDAGIRDERFTDDLIALGGKT